MAGRDRLQLTHSTRSRVERYSTRNFPTECKCVKTCAGKFARVARPRERRGCILGGVTPECQRAWHQSRNEPSNQYKILKPRGAWVENEFIEAAVGLLPRFSLPTPRRHSDEESESLRGVGPHASDTGRVVETIVLSCRSQVWQQDSCVGGWIRQARPCGSYATGRPP